MKAEHRHARLAAMAVLFCNGVLYSTWGVYVPTIKNKFDLSDATLSIAMMVVAGGGIVSLAQAGRWISLVGSGSASIVSGVLMSATAATILLIPNYPSLLLMLSLYGIATAMNDVAANAQGAFLEAEAQRSMIGSLHGSFSAGGLIGATTASAWAAASWMPELNFALVVGTGCLILSAASLYLLDDRKNTRQPPSESNRRSPLSVSDGDARQVRSRLIAFGALAFCGLVVEGAIYDWAAVYMREGVRASRMWTGLGYAAFAVGMALGRVAGDWVRDRVVHTMVILASCTISMIGLVIALCYTRPEPVVTGFFICGLGLSNVIPVMFSSAGKLSTNTGVPPSAGLALTTRVAYVGLLVGPLVIGPLSEHFGLKHALSALGVSVIFIGLGWLLLTHISGGPPWEIRGETLRQSGPQRPS